MEDAIQLEGVKRSFGAVRALDGLDLSVPRGRVVALLGRNGAGKTTTMRLLAGLLRAESGSLRVLGEDPWRLPTEKRRRVGYLAEEEFPFPTFDLAGAAGFLSCFHPSWDGEYLEQLVELFGVPTSAPYSSLSRGKRRQFQLALTLAPRPEVLLLDDPAQGLDVTVRRTFLKSVLPLLEEAGSAVLFSSHILGDVERIADEIAIIHEGRLLLQESADDLKQGAVRIVVSGVEAEPPRGCFRVRTLAGEQAFSVLHPDPDELEALRRRGATVIEQPLDLEELFVDLVEARDKERVRA